MSEVIQKAYIPEHKGGFRPKEYAHIVFKTAQVDNMIEWYCTVLNMQPVLRSSMINFLTWDGSQDRLAIVPMQDPEPRAKNAPGLHHAAFEVDSVADLVERYRFLKEKGIMPTSCVNHGVATAIYYVDPDGNEIELTCESFKTPEQANAWFATGAFDDNPYGVPFDPEELCARVDAGESEESINQPHKTHATWLKDILSAQPES
ncbi:VOC family protein [Maricurvus nonylphenolicus]|uniref:VOC family protein n=1 Tax=Maricurvus nonylphenolicus TaxID=1008307 RepID=UPI0036F2B020